MTAADPATQLRRRAHVGRARAIGRQRQHSPRRVHMLLRAAIGAGMLRLREHLVEADLIHEYGASRQAVRHAMALLAGEGLVSRAVGVGTVVVGGISEIALTDAGFAPGAGIRPDRISVATLDERAVPSSTLLRQLLATDEPELRMAEHLIRLDSEPLCVFTAYSSLAFPARTAGMVEGGLASTFRAAYGTTLRRVESTVHAVSSDATTCNLLGVPIGSPILCRERILRDHDLIPREVGFTYYPGSWVAFRSAADLDT